MKIKFIINHYSNIADGIWSSTATNIVEAFDNSVEINEGDLNDTFSFKIPNTRNVWSSFFKQQDNVQIYYDINDSGATNSTFLINGLIKQIESRSEPSGKHMIIKGVSFSEISTNALVFHTNTNVDVMQFLRGCLDSVKLRNTGFGVTWNNQNPSIKSNGNAFPKLYNGGTAKEFDKSLNSILNKYLTNQYTSDGNYYWFINNDKELVIRKRASGVSYNVREGVDFKTNRVTITDDIKNYIIIKCGNDAEGRPISTRFDDPISRSKYGFKYYLLVRTNIAPDLITEQGFGSGSNYPSSYPYTTSWGETVSNDSEWNQSVRIEARRRGLLEGQNYASLRTRGLINVNLSFLPSVNYKIGDILNLTIPSYNLTNKQVRVKSIKYSIDSTDIVAYEEVIV